MTIEVPIELREKIGCGRRNRTFIFEFKARRVAGYTIPQKIADFQIANLRVVI
jgi:hypothetical protein